jgi:hypothetical protein
MQAPSAASRGHSALWAWRAIRLGSMPLFAPFVCVMLPCRYLALAGFVEGLLQ